jgi:3-phenylpropionate/trans-cinnamate dioxygenase ferredoxin component
MSGRFVAVCPLDELPDGELREFEVPGDDDPIRVVAHSRGELFALSGICPHLGAPLGEGIVDGGLLVCAHHGSAFDCRTGEPVHPPAARPLRRYPVRIEDDTVLVGVDALGRCTCSGERAARPTQASTFPL